ncbi:hypothetical protein QU481_03260 [Crenobacter sp. SG2303]|uniref:Immunity protein 72 domain-containing protein n=1 Tax=Crenobacter oryzisoli TaxID=3056844 RepID=A0ABT7XJJ2_9NEIS|nr:hypothetical protein [Crenobacter sp. SG2303]MDN0073910.1 hypothetical protein [Crenobacter sp. SG2303]
MAQLHPQEIYLLEYFTSLEHFCNVRDAMREAVRLGEQCLDEFMHHLPADLRRRHTSEQPDVVWGGLVLPNLRSSLDGLIEGCILRSHNDPQAYRGLVGTYGGNINKNIGEFDASWMPEPLGTAFWDALDKAIALDKIVGYTIGGSWQAGDLTWSCNFDDPNDVLGGTDVRLPTRIPAYELDHSVVITPGDQVKECGVYLPDAENTAAQFLHPGRWWQEEPGIWVRQGLVKDEYGWWAEAQDVYPSRWTLVRRVPGQFIEVPQEGFYPKQILASSRTEAGQPCPQAGWWWSPAKEGSRRAFQAGEVMPDFPESSYGSTIWYREIEQ